VEVERQSLAIVKSLSVVSSNLSRNMGWCDLGVCRFWLHFQARYKRHAGRERDFGGGVNETKRGEAEVVNVATALFLSAHGATIKWGGGAWAAGRLDAVVRWELTRIRIWEVPASKS